MTTSLARADTVGSARARALPYLVLVASVVVVVVASVLVGARMVGPAAVFDSAHVQHAIVEARLERTVVGLLAGGALGLSGALMQGLTRNPLGDPGLLGVNAGASLAMVVAISIVGVSGIGAYIWFGFAGAAVAMALVHAVAAIGGSTPIKIAIAGAAVSAIVMSWTSGVLLQDRRTFETFRLWQVGTIGGRGYDAVITCVPFFVAGIVLALLSVRALDAYALGEDLAAGLGRKVWLDRTVIATGAVLLAATATALAGPIAFVGLAVPHMVRRITAARHAVLLPLCFGFGAVLTLAADVVGRVIWPPTEIQVGVMTGVLGCPVLVLLLLRGRRV